nr:RecName: Full=34 kDa cell wall protein [Nicotiana tabacum]
AHVEVPNSLY